MPPSPTPRHTRLHPWRIRALRWVKHHGLLVLGVLVLVVVICGWVGFAIAYSKHTPDDGFGDRNVDDFLYLACQLFTLESGWVPSLGNGWLQFARWAAALMVFGAPLVAWIIFSYDRLRLSFFRDHVVICGLGQRGLLLAKEYHAQNRLVVIIHRDAQSLYARECKEAGMLVLEGDATDPEVLLRARLPWASSLVAMTADDSTNATIVHQAREAYLQATHRTAHLTCWVHLVNPVLRSYFGHRLFLQQPAGVTIEFFSIFHTGAQMLVEQYEDFTTDTNATPHLCLVGLGYMGSALLVTLARTWWATAYRRHGRPLPITVIDPQVEEQLAALHVHYPALARVCTLRPLAQTAHAALSAQPTLLRDITSAYLCLGEDSETLATAVTLAERMPHDRAKAVAILSGITGISQLAADHSAGEAMPRPLRLFNLKEETCTPATLDIALQEKLARQYHAMYLRRQCEAGATPATNSSLVPWEALREDLRRDNRKLAADLLAKLAAIGAELVPMADWDAVHFTREEIETLAQQEHARWMAEKQRNGFTRGPEKTATTHPSLVPWAELSEAERQKDRDTIIEIPFLLAQVGYGLARRQSHTPPIGAHGRDNTAG